MKKNLMEKWDQLKATLLCVLCGAKFVTITTEFWTYLATDAYVGITAHYITDDLQLQSAVLQTSGMKESHTSENISSALRNQLGTEK